MVVVVVVVVDPEVMPIVTGDVTGEELYRRFLNGDNYAFEELVRLYEDELSRFIHNVVRDYYEAELLTVETFAQLALNKRPFEGKSTLKTYVFAIGKNLIMQHMKKRGREQHLSFEDAASALISCDENLGTSLEKNEKKHELHDAMRKLKKEYHAVLILLYFEDMSYKQAGQIMNKNEKQIKNLAFRAKSALKRELENKNFSNE